MGCKQVIALGSNKYLTTTFKLAGRIIDPLACSVAYNGNKKHIRRKELEIIAILSEHHGKLVERSYFITELWDGNILSGESGLTRTMGDLRKTLEDNDKVNPVVTTIHRKGYRLNSIPDFIDADKAAVSQVFSAASTSPYQLTKAVCESPLFHIYKAKQQHPLQRDVCIKIDSYPLEKDETDSRLLAESKLLSQLDHPNIIRVLDIGKTEQQEQYTVFEYFNGSDIKSFCKNQNLSVEESIGLILQLCDGISHAHRNGIIHGAINPKNIVVKQSYEGTSTVKIIGFELAKPILAAEEDSNSSPVRSYSKERVLYFSPEQKNNVSHGLDERTDIYSIGMLLLELVLDITANEKKRGNRLLQLSVKTAKFMQNWVLHNSRRNIFRIVILTLIPLYSSIK